MSDLANQLRADAEHYRLHGGDTDAICKSLSQAADRIAELEKENNILRTLAAKGNADCPYCGLSAEDMMKCPSGFPGCARADDLMAIYEIREASDE